MDGGNTARHEAHCFFFFFFWWCEYLVGFGQGASTINLKKGVGGCKSGLCLLGTRRL